MENSSRNGGNSGTLTSLGSLCPGGGGKDSVLSGGLMNSVRMHNGKSGTVSQVNIADIALK